MATLTCPTILFPLQARKNPEESGVTETPVGLVQVNDDGGSDDDDKDSVSTVVWVE